MASQVVVPFPGSEHKSIPDSGFSRDGWRPAPGGLDRRSLRARVYARLSTAKQVARAVLETMSYLAEARVRPPLPPALPPARTAK